jgi:hypothetical protein
MKETQTPCSNIYETENNTLIAGVLTKLKK